MLLLLELRETDRLRPPTDWDSVSDMAPGGARKGLSGDLCLVDATDALRFGLRFLTVLRMSEPRELRRDREEKLEADRGGVTMRCKAL